MQNSGQEGVGNNFPVGHQVEVLHRDLIFLYQGQDPFQDFRHQGRLPAGKPDETDSVRFREQGAKDFRI